MAEIGPSANNWDIISRTRDSRTTPYGNGFNTSSEDTSPTPPVRISITRIVKYSRAELLRIREAMKLSLIPVSLPKATSIAISTFGLEAGAENESTNENPPEDVSANGNLSETTDIISRDSVSLKDSNCNSEITSTAETLGSIQLNTAPSSKRSSLHLDDQGHQDKIEEQSTPIIRSTSLRRDGWRVQQRKVIQTWSDSHNAPNDISLETGHSDTYSETSSSHKSLNSQPSLCDISKNRLNRSVSIWSTESADSVKERQRQMNPVKSENEPGLKQRPTLKRRNASPMKARLKINSMSSDSGILDTLANEETELKPPPVPKRRQESPVKMNGISSPDSNKSVKFAEKDLISNLERGRSVTFEAKQGLTMTVQLHNSSVKNRNVISQSQRKTVPGPVLTDNNSNNDQGHETSDEDIPRFAVIDTSVPTYSPKHEDVRNITYVTKKEDIRRTKYSPQNEDVRITTSNDSRHERVPGSNSKHRNKSKLYSDIRKENKTVTDLCDQDVDYVSKQSQQDTHPRFVAQPEVTLRKKSVQRSHSLHGNKEKDKSGTNKRHSYLDDLDSVYSSYVSKDYDPSSAYYPYETEETCENYHTVSEQNYSNQKMQRGIYNTDIRRSKSFGTEKENIENNHVKSESSSHRMVNDSNVRRVNSENRHQQYSPKETVGDTERNYEGTTEQHNMRSRSFLKAKGTRNAYMDTNSKSQANVVYPGQDENLYRNQNSSQRQNIHRENSFNKPKRASSARPNRSKSFHDGKTHQNKETTKSDKPEEADTIEMMNEFYDKLYSSKNVQPEPEINYDDNYLQDKIRSKSAPRTRPANRSKSQSNQNRRPASPEKSVAYKVITDTGNRDNASTQKRHIVRLVTVNNGSEKQNNQLKRSASEVSSNPWANFKNVDPAFIAKSATPTPSVGIRQENNYQGHEPRSQRRRRPKPNTDSQGSAHSYGQDFENSNEMKQDWETTKNDAKSSRAARNAMRRRRQREKKRLANASAHGKDNVEYTGGYSDYDD